MASYNVEWRLARAHPAASQPQRPGGACRGWGWSHTGATLTRRARGVTQESPQHATFSAADGRGEGPFCIEEWGPPPSPTAFSRPQRRRAARPDWWGSRTSPSSTQRAQQSANESPPPRPQTRADAGVAPRRRKHTHDGRRRPLSRCRRSSLGCQSVAACGEGSGGVRFVLASGGRAKGSGGKSEQTARMRSTCVTSTPRVT